MSKQPACPIGSLLPPGTTVRQPPPLTHPQPARRRAQPCAAASALNMPAVYTVGSDFVGILSLFANWSRRITPHIRDFASSWAERTRDFWENGMRSGKFLAALSVVAGLAILAFAAYLVVILLPLILLGAFIAAVLTNVGKQ